ncbi:TPA: hypothetical protein ACGI5H_003582, partial [Clostridioides difficile]
IKFLNDFVFVSDMSGKIEISNGKISGLVKYDVNLNPIIYADSSRCTNFDIYNGYIYMLYIQTLVALFKKRI